MIALLIAASLVQQTPPPAAPRTVSPEETATLVQGVETMQELYRTFGACERHWPRAAVDRFKSGFQPERGQAPNGVQRLMAQAYQAGRIGEPRSAVFCREAMRMLREQSSNR